MTPPEDLAGQIAAHGWLVVRGPGPAASTAGLTASGLPELVVLGLPADLGGAVLHALAERLLAGEQHGDGSPVGGLLDGADPVLLTVPEPPDGLPAGQVYGEAVRLRQLVWPDAEGRLPWDAGFPHTQPLLAPPPVPWPLDEDPHLQVLSSRRVADEGATVLVVVRGADGDLRFLDGVSDFDPGQAVPECLHDALQRDLGLVEAVAAVAPGQAAERDGLGLPWQVRPW